MGIPRVTIYLLVGLALGPQGLLRWTAGNPLADALLLGPGTRVPLDATGQIALGFILFGIGAVFRFDIFRRVGPRILALSACEIGATGLLVAVAVYAGTGDARLALVAPALAISSAPSATLVTLREVEAEGPTSRCLILCVGHNNLVALLAFPLLLSLAFGGGDALRATGLALGAIGFGGLLGLAAAVGLERIMDRRELVLLGMLVVLCALGGVHLVAPGSTGLGMLACFAAGTALANGSPHSASVFRYVENTVYPLYVLFFIGAGRELHVDALADAGVLGVAFIAARATGKLVGARLGLRAARFEDDLPAGLGAGLLCQAGIALGLVSALEIAAPSGSADLRHVVVASVVVFELVGPWLVRQTAVRAGEVKLANLLPHSEARGMEALRWVVLELRRNLGWLRADVETSSGDPTVRHAMRRRPHTIAEESTFERVLKALGEIGAEPLPVLDSQGRFKGVISYDQVKNTLYDPGLRDLVIAGDLTDPVDDPLLPDSPLSTALERMDKHRVHAWPVVEEDSLVGMVRRSDVYALVRRS